MSQVFRKYKYEGFSDSFHKKTLKKEFGRIKLKSEEYDNFSYRYRKESVRSEAWEKNINLSQWYEDNLKE